MNRKIADKHAKLKARYPDKLVFIGIDTDYVTFQEDAILAAKALNLDSTLKFRNGKTKLSLYTVFFTQIALGKLVKAGYKVATVDEVNSPSKNKRRKYA